MRAADKSNHDRLRRESAIGNLAGWSPPSAGTRRGKGRECSAHAACSSVRRLRPPRSGRADAAWATCLLRRDKPRCRLAHRAMGHTGRAVVAIFRSVSGEAEVIGAVAPEAAVRIVRGPRRRAIELVQDGAVLPCTDKHGAPRELDLFFGPKDRSAPGPNALTTGPVPLARLRSLVLTTIAGVRYGMTAFPKGCSVNQGAAIAAVILNNLSKRPSQTLFYKVSLSPPCGPGPAARVRACRSRDQIGRVLLQA